MQLFTQKVAAAFARFVYFLASYPRRVLRLLKHFAHGLDCLRPRQQHWWESVVSTQAIIGIGYWWAELPFYLLDLIGVAELYETLADFVKFGTRKLEPWEIELARSVYGDSIRYDLVRLDERAYLGPRQHRFAYVSMHTINSWGKLQNATLIHELMHVWQYEQHGIVYILRSLRAQHSKMGYNYGGVSALRSAANKGKYFKAFNYEQQADILSDYYRIRNGYKPEWGLAKRSDLQLYYRYVKQLGGVKSM